MAPHQNTVSHVDPHAPLAGLPPGEGNAPLPPSYLSPRTSLLNLNATAVVDSVCFSLRVFSLHSTTVVTGCFFC